MTNSDETPDESNGTPEEPSGADTPEPTKADDSQPKPDDPKATGATTEEIEDELPEWEPLTPELAEEEAMRGDFMLRWAVVLMAFLMACTEINTTSTLIHIKSGEQLAANGYLPSATDTLSYTTSELKSSNLSWLFDVTIATVHSAAGPMGLTLFKALLIAVAFYALVNTSIPGVSTWWNAICCAIALIAALPRFTATPDVITLLGLALTFRWLQHWRTGVSKGFPWQIPVLFVVWANMDARMFLGVLLVLAYVVGDQLSGLLNKSKTEEPGRPSGWLLAIVCLVCACLNPATFETLTSPLNLYQTEYPALRQYHSVSVVSQPSGDHLQYYSVAHPAFVKWLDQSAIAAIALLVVVIVLLVMNPKGLEAGHLLALLIFAGLAAFTTHEFGAMAIVAAGIAAALGQKWYRNSFNQEYTVDTKELIFSRGGRAVTVVGLFAMAFLFASGRISNSANGDAARVGLGFEPNLDNAITGLKGDLEDADPELHVYNFTMEQGDLLAWAGQPHFIDSRSRLFAGSTVLADHNATRRAMRAKNELVAGSGDSSVWKKAFADYDVQVAMPRMYGKTPDIVTFRDLSQSPDWKLLYTGASSAAFAPVSLLADKRLGSLASEKTNSVVQAAFRTDNDESFERPDFAREPGFNEKYVFPVRSVRTDSFLKARNYHAQLFNTQQTVPNAIALAYLAIQNANATLVTDPNNANAYLILAQSYEMLGSIESQQFGASTARMRSLQKIAAVSQALVVQPDNMATLEMKMQLHAQQGQVDLALPVVTKLIDLMEATNPTDPASVERLEQWYAAQKQLSQQVKANTAEVDKVMASVPAEQLPQVIGQIAAQLQSQGFINKAMSVLGDPNDSTRDPMVQVNYGTMLLQAGRIEEAATTLEKIRGAGTELPAQYAQIPWQFPCAMSSAISGGYTTAESVFNQKALEMDKTVKPERLNHMLRLAMTPATWRTRPSQTMLNRIATVPLEIATLRLYSGICSLEEGKSKTAENMFQLILKECPESPETFLAKFYYDMITGENYKLDPPDEWIALAPEGSETDAATPADPDAVTPDTTTPEAGAKKTDQPAADEPAAKKPAADKPADASPKAEPAKEAKEDTPPTSDVAKPTP